jgi:hypothetical protein
VSEAAIAEALVSRNIPTAPKRLSLLISGAVWHDRLE